MFIVVAVTGGIAAYKSVHLVRLLVKAGHEVHVVPTDDALRFVGLPTWQGVSRNAVTTSVHDDVASVRHVALGQSADLVIVAPATANSLAKMAVGIADNLVGTTLLATRAPVVVAPAMHTEMWQHPATVNNIEVLRSRGVVVVGPETGELTGGDSGAGRMSEPETIVDAALSAAGAGRDLAGLRVLVSTGGTREPIDPVRFLGNRSSGRQGVAVALAAAQRGAAVTLVAAHTDEGVLATVSGQRHIALERVSTARELEEAMHTRAALSDVIVMAAAVADYRPVEVSSHKLSKEAAGDGVRSLDLAVTPDILRALVADRANGQTIVGFAAETPQNGETLVDRGRRKAARKGVDLLAVNEVGWSQGFESEANALTIIDRAGAVVNDVSGTKRQVADALWDAIVVTRSR
ncbi:bifunctional phosphopantothenoylcysteine decarboxylase/phosphopantothenate--cysteine ligase CoaBC [Microbacterium sp. R86528]|uniref:bifunctional phosphopantothenoylcysteine decarboxylase/phosphopantothenate--cysteine ligase CoaBC n=1 Tax=Microbacterium sp. R86528 TaxID=3093864 RepID=UPI0037CBB65F